jgi:hypothetical protein
MPEISRFLGIILAMYYQEEHPVPHFHVKYAGQVGVFSFSRLKTSGLSRASYQNASSRWFWNGPVNTAMYWVYSKLVDCRPFGFPLSATNRRKRSCLVDHESLSARGNPKGLNPF